MLVCLFVLRLQIVSQLYTGLFQILPCPNFFWGPRLKGPWYASIFFFFHVVRGPCFQDIGKQALTINRISTIWPKAGKETRSKHLFLDIFVTSLVVKYMDIRNFLKNHPICKIHVIQSGNWFHLVCRWWKEGAMSLPEFPLSASLCPPSWAELNHDGLISHLFSYPHALKHNWYFR